MDPDFVEVSLVDHAQQPVTNAAAQITLLGIVKHRP